MKSAPAAPPDLEQFRGYLKLLAEVQLSPRLRQKADASDLVQSALLEAHRDLAAYRGTSDAELLAWIKTILTRNVLNLAKHFGRQKCDLNRERSLQAQLEQSSARLDQFLASEQTTPSGWALRHEQAEQLTRALAALLDDERTAVTLKHFHNWPVAEIADHLGRSPDAVAGLLRRGLKKLRAQMGAAASSQEQ
jgi:RNA polymerase sigma-70 factor (ECF subfamily)